MSARPISDLGSSAPGLPEIEQARARLDGVARVTPVYSSETLSVLAGREVHLKAENLQRTGSFKVRGAFNRISTLSKEELAAGVVGASAGNHGQAVAWAAREVGARARIFMPQDAPMAKVDATRHYGAEIELAGSAIEDALDGARAYVAQTGATFVHPYEDTYVIAGQGTIGLELAEQVPDAGTVVIPIGGGGLSSGIALALRAVRPDVRIVGVQAAGTLPDGPGFTIADGVAVKKPGELTSSILDRVLDDIVSVTDEEITESIVLLLERSKLVVEGAGAVSLAAILRDKVGARGSVVAVLSGGNIDATMLISVMRRGLAVAGRFLVLRTRVPDRPGELATLLTLLANDRVNVVEVEHQRETADLPVGETGVELTLLTRDAAHCEEILATLQRWGYPAQRLS
jgi:threonine dehydratase